MEYKLASVGIVNLNINFWFSFIVSNNRGHYKDLKVRVVRDIFYKKGPMAGLHSGLCYSNF